MDDLVQWIGTQLDTDAARALQWHDLECDIHAHLDAGLLAALAASRMLEDVPGAVCDCGGPARVLREVEAKRSLVAAYVDALTVGPDVEGGYKRPIREALARQARDFLLVMALPYAHRPGFAEAVASAD